MQTVGNPTDMRSDTGTVGAYGHPNLGVGCEEVIPSEACTHGILRHMRERPPDFSISGGQEVHGTLSNSLPKSRHRIPTVQHFDGRKQLEWNVPSFFERRSPVPIVHMKE